MKFKTVESSKGLIIKALHENDIYIKDIEKNQSEELYILGSYYSYYLIEVCKKNDVEEILKNTRFISKILDSKDEVLIEMFTIDVFINLHEELDNDNLLFQKMSEKNKLVFLNAIEQWNKNNAY